MVPARVAPRPALLASNVSPSPGPRMGRLGRGLRRRRLEPTLGAGGTSDVARRGRGRAEGAAGGQDGARRVICADFCAGGSGTRARGGSAPTAALPALPAPGAPSCPPFLHLGVLGGVGGGGPGSRDSMSDSEEESQDRQLKIVVLGDGTSGKVSPGRARCASLQAPGAALAPPAPPRRPGPRAPARLARLARGRARSRRRAMAGENPPPRDPPEMIPI